MKDAAVAGFLPVDWNGDGSLGKVQRAYWNLKLSWATS